MGLLDVLQSASNAVAGNVAGPVDLLSFLLRKGGVPVPEDALGGSEWMKRKGLMRDVPHGAEQVVGETLGLLAPAAIAANAPKIARGLLQAQANAAAPKTLHPETGAIVWHGSPYKFDRFDSSKMGTGEGAQAYGAGTYLAEARKVGEDYQKMLAYKAFDVGPEAQARGIPLSASARGEFVRQAQANVDPAIAAKRLQNANITARSLPQEKLSELFEAYKKDGGGHLYKVDLPDELIPRMLDWDKKLSQQPAEIQQAVNRLWADNRVYGNPMQLNGEGIYGSLNARFNGGMNRMRAQEAASMDLRHYGIPGIRYLDGGSRGAGQGTSNFVVFPGLEDQLKILERNGVPLGLLTPPTPSYGIAHRPMTIDGGAAAAHDLTATFGKDIYGPKALQYFGSGDPREKNVLRVLTQIRGKPDAEVTIYRGIPKGAAGEFNAGDWVTLDKAVAADYGEQVISKKVKAKDITSWADSLLEFGYYPGK